jgi:NADH:ubiquinone oxidoreductase subunit 6 (subunit J)
MTVTIGLLGIAAFCAIQAMRAVRLLNAALWLVGVSLASAALLYQFNATLLAVIELSLSVGLVTILLVFAISMVGADSPDRPQSRFLYWPLVVVMLLLVIGLTVPLLAVQPKEGEISFQIVFWELRQGDVLAQVALIFTGALGVLGLLSESAGEKSGSPTAASQPHAAAETTIEAPPHSPQTETEPELERV